MSDEAKDAKCSYPGCVSKGTHRIVLVLLSVKASLHYGQPVTQKRDLDPLRRCAAHVDERSPEVLIRQLGWSLEGVLNRLSGDFETTARKKLGAWGITPDWARTTVHYVCESDDITEIPVFVEMPGGAERAGTVKVRS